MRSASQRGARPEALAEVVADWSASWRREQEGVSRLLDDAIARMDRDALRSAAGQLYEINSRKFDGLDGVLRRLLDRTNNK
jgi:hypothetical protein